MTVHSPYHGTWAASVRRMSDDLRRLREKLCRELSQSERSATVHPRREAKRLGDVPPAHAFLAIAEHAESVARRLSALIRRRQPVGARVGAVVGEMLSQLRHALFDRMIDRERSYRGTLLGLHHGMDLTRLLRDVALRLGDVALVRLCDELLVERLSLIEHAEQALAWFAEHPDVALGAGTRRLLQPGPT